MNTLRSVPLEFTITASLGTGPECFAAHVGSESIAIAFAFGATPLKTTTPLTGASDLGAADAAAFGAALAACLVWPNKLPALSRVTKIKGSLVRINSFPLKCEAYLVGGAGRLTVATPARAVFAVVRMGPGAS